MKTLLHKNSLLLLLFLIFFANQLTAQNGIVSISPAQANAGTTVSATITLDSNATPPLPPSQIKPTSVVIGTVSATAIQRTDETTVTASFDLPSGMSSGSYDVQVSFEPPNGTVTYTLSGGFWVGSSGSPILTGDIAYVDGTNGSDSNSGDSWAKAKKTISSGIEAARSAGGSEIWVKAGTYYTTTGTDRSESFTLPTNMTIYGGFAGTESAVNERTNFGSGESNETILSGDIGTKGTNTDNTYRIMVTGKNCTVDGFTFTKAYANGEFTERMGGGIYLADDASTVKNCHFENNYAEAGGAMYVFNINGATSTNYQTVAISNCSFNNNEANLGGAIVFRVGASTNMTSCTFENNSAKWRGGAVFIDYGAYQNYPIVIDQCTFTANSCEGNGGAIYTDDMASQLQGTYYTISNCSFTSNSTTYRGGAICTYNTANYPTIKNNTFTSNAAGLSGNAIAGDNGPSLTINNNTFNSGQDINLDEACNCSGTDCP